MGYFDDLVFNGGGVVPRCHRVLGPHHSENCALKFVLSGRMYFSVDDEERTILEGPTAFWHHPRHFYHYGPVDEAGWYHHWLAFRGPRAQRLLEEGFLPLAKTSYLKVLQPTVFAGTLVEIIDIVCAGDARRHGQAVLLLERLLQILTEQLSQGTRVSPHCEHIARIAQEVREQPCCAYDFRRIARATNLSYSHFRRLFRQETGRPPHNYLLFCRMQKAACELQAGNRQIKAIGLEAGYEVPAHFSRAFRRQIGTSPEQFRETL